MRALKKAWTKWSVREDQTGLDHQDLVIHAPVALAIIALDGGEARLVLSNPAFVELVGPGVPDSTLWTRRFTEATRADQPVTFLLRQDNPRAPILAVSARRLGADHRRVAIVARDFTADYQKDLTLDNERKQLRLLTQNIADVIYMINLDDHQMVYVSPSYETVWERSCDSLYKNPRSFLDAIHSEDLPLMFHAMKAQLTQDFEVSYRIQTLDGRTKWIHDRTHLVVDGSGRPSRMVGIATEVTDRVVKDELITRQATHLRDVVDAVPMAMVSLTRDGRVEWANVSFRRFFSTDQPTTRDQIIARLMNTEHAEARDHVRARAGMWREFTLNANGAEVLVDVHSTALPGGHTLVLIKDITRRKERERVIETQRLQMVHASRLSALGKMAAGIAHEINNPLAIIGTSAQILRDQSASGSPNPEQIRSASERIANTVNRIARIIAGLRLIARDGTNDPAEPVDLRQVVKDALDLCQARMKNHAVELDLILPVDPVVVTCRPVQIAQVLVNLLNNAFDAVVGVSPARVRVELGARGPRATLEVADSGAGIPPEIQSRIMEPFFTTKPVGQGTGLGLGLAKGIVDGHGGEIAFETSTAGTTFRITLPL